MSRGPPKDYRKWRITKIALCVCVCVKVTHWEWPPAECVYFTNNKKAPRTPTCPDYHEWAPDGSLACQPPINTPSHKHTHTSLPKPPTVALILQWAKDAYQLSPTPVVQLKSCCAFVLLSCNSICLKIFFWLADPILFVKMEAMTNFLLSQNYILCLKSHADGFIVQVCGACFEVTLLCD